MSEHENGKSSDREIGPTLKDCQSNPGARFGGLPLQIKIHHESDDKKFGEQMERWLDGGGAKKIETALKKLRQRDHR